VFGKGGMCLIKVGLCLVVGGVWLRLVAFSCGDCGMVAIG